MIKIIKKTNGKFRKACHFKIFENLHLLFTLKVGFDDSSKESGG